MTLVTATALSPITVHAAEIAPRLSNTSSLAQDNSAFQNEDRRAERQAARANRTPEEQAERRAERQQNRAARVDEGSAYVQPPEARRAERQRDNMRADRQPDNVPVERQRANVGVERQRANVGVERQRDVVRVEPQREAVRVERQRAGVRTERRDASQDGRYYDRNRDGNLDRRWDRNRDGNLDRNWDRNRDGRLDRRFDRNDDERIDRRYDRNQNGQLDRRVDRNNDNRLDRTQAGRWTNNWRNDSRYNWRSYREQNRNYYSPGRYYSPYRGRNYSRISIGFSLGSGYYGSRYWINDPWQYRLPAAYGPYRWVRYYDDVLLVDLRNGRVVDVIRDFFW
jgi:hypothetical protein